MIPRRTRKAINQINVVPYIDVMLVLLVIFMVTSPFINPSQVSLPSMGKSAGAPNAPLEVVVREDGGLLLRDRSVNAPGQPVAASALRAEVRTRLRPGQAVVISADKGVRYEAVMQVMDALQSLGVAHVGLLVKPAPEHR